MDLKNTNFRQKYPFANILPGTDDPEWFIKADSLNQLADKLEIDNDVLNTTLSTFNKYVEAGDDLDFGRGKSEYDFFYGDRSQSGISATLGKVEKPPFYAVKIDIGALGTNGGMKTDGFGRVISASGNIIDGLYTVGNAMAGSTGSVYAGAGGTLGPALTYGYLAGNHISGNNFEAEG